MIRFISDLHGCPSLLAEYTGGLSDKDYLLVCGDFGYVFRNSANENSFLDAVEEKPYTVLFIDGNHENFPAIFAYPEEKWHGGTVHRIRKNILHLMRGQIYEIEGKTIFTMGGAFSTDRIYRKKDQTYWDEELPSADEMKSAKETLESNHYQVDYIVTHTAPCNVFGELHEIPHPREQAFSVFLFDDIAKKTKYKRWFFGHFHQDLSIAGGYQCVYRQPIDIKT